MYLKEIIWVLVLTLMPVIYLKIRDYRDLKDRVVIQLFKPPKDLSVLEVGFFMDNKLLFKDMLAWVIDLHLKQYLTIQRNKNSKLEAVVNDVNTLQFTDLEEQFWQSLFKGKTQVNLNLVLQNYLTNLLPIVMKFYGELVDKGYLKKRSAKTYVLALVVGIVCFLSFGDGFSLVNLFLYLFLPSGSIWILLNTPLRTEKGKDLYAKLLGFKRFIEVAEKDRKLFEQNYIKNTKDYSIQLIDLMPYLIILNVGREWIQTVDSNFQDLVGKEDIFGLFSIYNPKDL